MFHVRVALRAIPCFNKAYFPKVCCELGLGGWGLGVGGWGGGGVGGGGGGGGGAFLTMWAGPLIFLWPPPEMSE